MPPIENALSHCGVGVGVVVADGLSSRTCSKPPLRFFLSSFRIWRSSFLDWRASDKKGEAEAVGGIDGEADGVAVAPGLAEVALAGAFCGTNRSAFRSCLSNCFSAFRCSFASPGRPNAGGDDVELAIVGLTDGAAELSGETARGGGGVDASAAVAVGNAQSPLPRACLRSVTGKLPE